VLPRGLATYAGAASGIIPFGTTAEAWGAATALGQDRAGNARLILDPRKHGLKLSQGCHSSWREPRLKRRKASAPPSQPFPAKLGEEGGMDAQPRPRHRQTATFAGVARHVVGMRLLALRLPFSAHDLVRKPVTAFRDHAQPEASSKRFLSWLGGRKTRTPKRAARTISFFRPRTQCGGGGPCGAWWRGRPFHRAKCAVPLPRFAGQDEESAARTIFCVRHCRA